MKINLQISRRGLRIFEPIRGKEKPKGENKQLKCLKQTHIQGLRFTREIKRINGRQFNGVGYILINRL